MANTVKRLSFIKSGSEIHIGKIPPNIIKILDAISKIPDGESYPTADIAIMAGVRHNVSGQFTHPALKKHRIKINTSSGQAVWWGSEKDIADEKKHRDKAGEAWSE